MNTTPAPEKKSRSENLLFRSRLEICRILQVLAQEQSPLSAEIMHGHPFTTRLVAVDPETDHFAIAYCAHKQINAMVLKSPSVEFIATDKKGLHFTFEAAAPEEVQVGGEPAIQFALPKALLLHNRREHPRIPLAADASLRCIADADGFIPFESHVTDISHDGLGCLIYDPEINLEAGAVLKGCRIILPNGDAVVADLELRYTATDTLADGSLANRSGFQFVEKSPELTKLINYFIQDLDKK